MSNTLPESLRHAVADSWERLAKTYDERHGDHGNDWHRILVEPVALKLLEVRAGMRVLDVGCGSGVLARRLASLGAVVVGADHSQAFLDHARARPGADLVEWRQVDATDRDAIASLGHFDAAVSTMTVMDLVDIEGIFHGVSSILGIGSPFVVVTSHPAFNHPDIVYWSEDGDGTDGQPRHRRGLRLTRYLSPYSHQVLGITGQPVPQWYFHRPLSELLRPAFDTGFVIDAMEEPAFPASPQGRFDSRPEFPPIIAVRFRLAGGNAGRGLTEQR